MWTRRMTQALTDQVACSTRVRPCTAHPLGDVLICSFFSRRLVLQFVYVEYRYPGAGGGGRAAFVCIVHEVMYVFSHDCVGMQQHPSDCADGDSVL